MGMRLAAVIMGMRLAAVIMGMRLAAVIMGMRLAAVIMGMRPASGQKAVDIMHLSLSLQPSAISRDTSKDPELFSPV